MDGIASLYQQYLNELQNPVVTDSGILYGLPAIMPRDGEQKDYVDPSTRYTDYTQGPLTNTQLSLLSAVNPMFGIVGYGQRLADQGTFDKFGRFGEGLRNFLESPASKFSRLYDPTVSIFGGGDEDRMGIGPGTFEESMATAESVDGGFGDDSETGYGGDYGGGVTGGSFGE